MTVEELRAAITELDLRILETINARIETVERLRQVKADNGLPFVDPDRERALLEELKQANTGPLSEAGVEELVTFVLGLVKRELAGA